MITVAINGFGRIGRLVYRALIESGRTDMEVVASRLVPHEFCVWTFAVAVEA